MAAPYGYGAPQTGGYGAPQTGGYGAPQAGGYGAPQPGGYGAPGGGYGAPGGYSMPGYAPAPSYGGMPGGYGYGAPAPGGYNPYGAGFAPANPAAWALFSAVDMDRSGSISQKELQLALSNGGWTPFSVKTTKMLIKMFDVDRSGTLSYAEFEKLLSTMDTWRKLFEGADKDRSGKLSGAEVKASVRALHFTCPDSVLDAIFKSYDDDGSGTLAFDEYARLLAELTSLTSAFRRFDPSGTGSATLNYNQFLDLVFTTRV